MRRPLRRWLDFLCKKNKMYELNQLMEEYPWLSFSWSPDTDANVAQEYGNQKTFQHANTYIDNSRI